ncbi:hypothetical protein IAR50_006597 [Cryptococcus sp. DSM 104548]
MGDEAPQDASVPLSVGPFFLGFCLESLGMGVVFVLSIHYLTGIRSPLHPLSPSTKSNTALVSFCLLCNTAQTLVDLARGWNMFAVNFMNIHAITMSSPLFLTSVFLGLLPATITQLFLLRRSILFLSSLSHLWPRLAHPISKSLFACIMLLAISTSFVTGTITSVLTFRVGMLGRLTNERQNGVGRAFRTVETVWLGTSTGVDGCVSGVLCLELWWARGKLGMEGGVMRKVISRLILVTCNGGIAVTALQATSLLLYRYTSHKAFCYLPITILPKLYNMTLILSLSLPHSTALQHGNAQGHVFSLPTILDFSPSPSSRIPRGNRSNLHTYPPHPHQTHQHPRRPYSSSSPYARSVGTSMHLKGRSSETLTLTLDKGGGAARRRAAVGEREEQGHDKKHPTSRSAFASGSSLPLPLSVTRSQTQGSRGGRGREGQGVGGIGPRSRPGMGSRTESWFGLSARLRRSDGGEPDEHEDVEEGGRERRGSSWHGQNSNAPDEYGYERRPSERSIAPLLSSPPQWSSSSLLPTPSSLISPSSSTTYSYRFSEPLSLSSPGFSKARQSPLLGELGDLPNKIQKRKGKKRNDDPPPIVLPADHPLYHPAFTLPSPSTPGTEPGISSVQRPKKSLTVEKMYSFSDTGHSGGMPSSSSLSGGGTGLGEVVESPMPYVFEKEEDLWGGRQQMLVRGIGAGVARGERAWDGDPLLTPSWSSHSHSHSSHYSHSKPHSHSHFISQSQYHDHSTSHSHSCDPLDPVGEGYQQQLSFTSSSSWCWHLHSHLEVRNPAVEGTSIDNRPGIEVEKLRLPAGNQHRLKKRVHSSSSPPSPSSLTFHTAPITKSAIGNRQERTLSGDEAMRAEKRSKEIARRGEEKEVKKMEWFEVL